MKRISTVIVLAIWFCQCSTNAVTLEEFVAEADATGRLLSHERSSTESGTIHFLEFESVVWKDGYVQPAQWRHSLKVFVPRTVTSTTAFLMISNGVLSDDVLVPPDPIIEQTAVENGCIAVEAALIPNQRLTFGEQSEARLEDDLVAYSWRKYLDTGDRTWLAQYPMVKSTKMIMDQIQAQGSAWGKPVDSFVVSGQSKRGWAAWLIAALDERVTGVIPIVIDLVNINASMSHHKQVYNGWSWALQDYERHGITELLDQPDLEPITSQLDPIRYVDRLLMPKYIVNAANDEFFLPDSSQFYFNELQSAKYLRYIPNSGHRLRPDYRKSVSTFVGSVIHGRKLPQISWREDRNQIEVHTDAKPTAVKLWEAHNPAARDFRFGKNFARYQSTLLRAKGVGKYQATVHAPKGGWKAYFIELSYDLDGDEFVLSSPVFIKGRDNVSPL